MSARGRRLWVVPALSFVVALALTVVPLPDAVATFRPDWVAMVMLYWCLVEPRRHALMSAFCVGLVLDTLAGSLLGEHALALLVVTYLAQRLYLRIRTFPAMQIALTVFILLGLYEFILYWIDGMTGHETALVERWGPVVTGGVLWLFALTGMERGQQEAAARM